MIILTILYLSLFFRRVMIYHEKITFSAPSQRIDQWLSKEFPYSRNFFHHIIERGGIQVNGNVVKKSYKLKRNDTISIDDLQRYLSPIILEEAPKISIPIVLEKEDYLIIDKPKGVLSHPNSIWDVSTPSVVGFLYHHYKELPSIGNFIRAGLVHRLDKETNGLMIIAKTEKGLQHFKNLFQAKSLAASIDEKEKIPLKKKYKATCHSTNEAREFLSLLDTADLPYYISENVIPKVPHPTIKLGITKILEYNIHNNDTITFTIEILTGRTHQIRYHLSHKGLPIVGDYIYGKEESSPLQLTAYSITFQDCSRDEIIHLEI